MKKMVYVSADWCQPCRRFKPIVQKVSSDLGIPVEYVNVDYDTTYVQKYGIQSVPTTLFFNQGSMAWMKSGIMQESDLKSMLTQ